MKTIHRLWLPLFIVVNICGCTTGDSQASAEVLNHRNCQTLKAGISSVSFADIAEIRGSKLIDMTAPEEPQAKADLLLLAISNGPQPTPGFGFSLTGTHLEGDTAVIELFWEEPDADSILPQVMIHPCIVVGVEASKFSKVRAVDQHGKLLGELTL